MYLMNGTKNLKFSFNVKTLIFYFFIIKIGALNILDFLILLKFFNNL
jgi:hypothetical protein